MVKLAQIIVAGGKGLRAGGDTPKQYSHIGNKPLIYRTLEALSKVESIQDFHPDSLEVSLIIVHDPAHTDMLQSAVKGYRVSKVHGGETRTESVRAGIESLKDNPPDYVLIHDAARPFVSVDCLADLLNKMQTHQAAVPVLPIADAVKSFVGNEIQDDVERGNLRRVQTPQIFHFKDIEAAYQDLPAGLSLPDDIAVARRAGLSIATVLGDEHNFKVTYPSDFEKAETLLKMKSMSDQKTYYTATGSGYDVHRYTDGDGIWLCGIKIPAPYTLLGHSDADVGLHALTDAIFGAIADGDIGDHFPPSDPKWKGARSDQFLDYAVKRLKERGGKLQHVDVTLICEKPKVKPHREAMRTRLSEIIGLPISRISVKATTTEKLGFTGREEGMAASAIATVSLPE